METRRNLCGKDYQHWTFEVGHWPLDFGLKFWHTSKMPGARLKQSLRATFLGLCVNAVLAVLKLLAGIFGNSHALVADAVESLADIFSSIIVWRGVVVAEEPADEDHPYGHGKAEPLAAALVAAMLLVAAGWIVVGALRAVNQPHAAPRPFTLV